ncbi:hypothetical protein T4B_15552 [Trichinella pseudospiralis]|uniref:Uncharacterized protein n=1 Tax=Trichinella pseudospiralis TaxID=6337 RepID=A0A0V1GC17_TRIPS|nr:hypothetical protein T4B_15552 [Trichinella pseudospiralis]
MSLIFPPLEEINIYMFPLTPALKRGVLGASPQS